MNPAPPSLAIVTGASSGIGRVFATRLAARGHAVLLVARDAARLEALAQELSARYHIEARTLPADLSREEEIERVARALEAAPDVGVLVNNAGFGTKGKFHKIDIDLQLQMTRLHVLAPMRLAHAVLPGMVARRAGWLINVSSIAGFMYGPGNASYCATKAYLTRFSQALDTELYDTGVVVQALCPGFTRSEFHDRLKMDRNTVPRFLWMSAESVVDKSLAAAARRGPVVCIPGFRNRVLTLLVEAMPQWVLRRGRAVTKRV